jgi:hypothetical protein
LLSGGGDEGWTAVGGARGGDDERGPLDGGLRSLCRDACPVVRFDNRAFGREPPRPSGESDPVQLPVSLAFSPGKYFRYYDGNFPFFWKNLLDIRENGEKFSSVSQPQFPVTKKRLNYSQ